MEMGQRGFANTVAANLARAMVELGRDEDAEKWVKVALEIGVADDLGAVGPALGVGARVFARRGEFEAAMEMGRKAVAAFEGADYLDQMADAHADLADVLRLAGRPDEAAAELRVALGLYERKGHLVGAEKTRRLLAEVGAGAEPAGAPPSD